MAAARRSGKVDWNEKRVAELRRLTVVEDKSMPEAARAMGLSPTQVKGAKQRFGILNGKPGGKGRVGHDIKMLLAGDKATTNEERDAIGRKHGISGDAVKMAVIRWRRLGRPGPVVTNGR